MAGRPSTITPAQREEFWRRYKAGESVLGIISALRQRPGNINRVLEASGGIAPVPRTRSQKVLRFCEREEISRGLAAGDSFRVIARRLNRAVSTVSQEVGRHGGRRRYRAAHADSEA
jgi:DNA-binding CsgD family transcriptional regulator